MALIERLERVRARVRAAAAEANRPQPRLIAVSKFHPASCIQTLLETTDQRDFGENYVQELTDKAARLSQEIRWHLIGPLQTNKVNKLLTVDNLVRVASLDSEKLAARLNAACAAKGRELSVFIEVNTSGETSKSGVAGEQVDELVNFVLGQCPALTFDGFMTIGHMTDIDVTRKGFAQLRELRDAWSAKLGRSLELSMGMSGDLQEAIRLGSTEVRIGTDIFGPRPQTASPDVAKS